MDEEHENNDSTTSGSSWTPADEPTNPVEPITAPQPAPPVAPAPEAVSHSGFGAPPAEGSPGAGWSWASPPPPPPGAPGTAGSASGGGGWAWIAPPPPPPPAGPAGGAQWSYPPGQYWVAAPLSQPVPADQHGARRAWAATAVAILVVIAMAAGFGVGRAAWRSATTTPPSTTLPSGSGNSGQFPFGSGGFSFGGGSSGSSRTSAGGPSDASAIASGVDPALVDVNTTLGYQAEEAAGTGIVLNSDGLVLTNNHVIDEATTISVTDVGNGHVYGASVVGYDRSSDVAVIQLHGASGLKVASLGDSSTAHVGQAVVAIGNAGGVGGTPSVAGGSITDLEQSITATEQDGGNPENLRGLVETNADIQPGDSGGPLVDTAGKVLGMDTAASAGFSLQTSGTQGYAIPINSAIAIAKRIEAHQGSASVHIGATGFLGVGVQPENGVTGAYVENVEPNTPAALAGLVPGDVVTSLDGKPVASYETLTNLLQQFHPGDNVRLGWTDSSGTRHSATLKLATGPAA
ncbi:MAG: trypsin-like peptidase domain-containing protein [Acidimicrobiales bacterium]